MQCKIGRKFIAFNISIILIFLLQMIAIVTGEHQSIHVGIGALTTIVVTYFGANTGTKAIKNKELL